MPMHLFFLGIEKNLISKTELIFKQNSKQHNEFWHRQVQSISQKQSDLNSVSINRCLPMSFTNLDQKQLGTSSWQSNHYLAFTCVLLFHFSCLESQNVPDGSRRGIKVFKRLRVGKSETWSQLVPFAQMVPRKVLYVNEQPGNRQ